MSQGEEIRLLARICVGPRRERERERERLEGCEGCSVAIAVGGHFRSDSISEINFNASFLFLGSSLCLRNA